MEKRSLRRHQQRVAHLRHVRIIWQTFPWHWEGTPFHVIPEPDEWLYRWRRRKPWQDVPRLTMNGEPKSWQYDHNIRPSRIRQNQLLRAIERGLDPDLVRRWPDYRKPHIYFW